MTGERHDFASMKASVNEYLRERNNSTAPPTVSDFVRQIGVKRSTFYSNYPELVALILSSRVDAPANRKGRPREERLRELQETISIKNREKRELEVEHGLYAEQIRRLSMENAELRGALESARGVSQLRPKTNP